MNTNHSLLHCADCPLNESDGSQLLSNGEEKLAERMMKDSEPRKSIGGWRQKEFMIR